MATEGARPEPRLQVAETAPPPAASAALPLPRLGENPGLARGIRNQLVINERPPE